MIDSDSFTLSQTILRNDPAYCELMLTVRNTPAGGIEFPGDGFDLYADMVCKACDLAADILRGADGISQQE